MGVTTSRMLSRKEAAALLAERGYPVTHRTLERMANNPKGPPYILFLGRNARYDPTDLLAWAERNTTRFG